MVAQGHDRLLNEARTSNDMETRKALEVFDFKGEMGEIRLHLNSPGGEVFEGIAIVNTLRNLYAEEPLKKYTTAIHCEISANRGPTFRKAQRPAGGEDSAFLELVFGMLLAIVMHRTIVGRGLVRTSALVPYAIVTVVAAFSWRFAWTQNLGWLAGDNAPLTEKWTSIGIIILAEVWKTVPFMALLLMAGLALVPLPGPGWLRLRFVEVGEGCREMLVRHVFQQHRRHLAGRRHDAPARGGSRACSRPDAAARPGRGAVLRPAGFPAASRGGRRRHAADARGGEVPDRSSDAVRATW